MALAWNQADAESVKAESIKAESVSDEKSRAGALPSRASI